MLTERNISKVCVAITVVTVLLTILYMVSGPLLGLNKSDGVEMFSEEDLTETINENEANKVDLSKLSEGLKAGNAYSNAGSLYIIGPGEFALTGEMKEGQIVIEASSNDTVRLVLDNASISNSSEAAFLVKEAKKVILTTKKDTSNLISSGLESTDNTKIDGALYSKDNLTLNGEGTLKIESANSHAVVCNDTLVISGGTLEVDAAEDAFHVGDLAAFTSSTINAKAGDDAVTVSNDSDTGEIFFKDGTLTVSECLEGLEASAITVEGGKIQINSKDDGFNATGGESPFIRIKDGDIVVKCPNGNDADGLDSNGAIYIEGGRTFVSMVGTGMNSAVDCGVETGSACEITGGTLIAAGSNMMDTVINATGQGLIQSNGNYSGETTVTLSNKEGKEILKEEIPLQFTNLVMSSADVIDGEEYTLKINDESAEVTAQSSVSSQGGFGGGFKGFGGAGFQNGNSAGQNMEGFQQPSENTADGAERPQVQPENGPINGRNGGSEDAAEGSGNQNAKDVNKDASNSGGQEAGNDQSGSVKSTGSESGDTQNNKDVPTYDFKGSFKEAEPQIGMRAGRNMAEVEDSNTPTSLQLLLIGGSIIALLIGVAFAFVVRWP